jgi:transcriptional regulator with XRE-family HTH domain
MASNPRQIYRAEMRKRMKATREAADLSQAEMAGKLRITHEAYKKAEQRGALPSDLIEPFADAVKEHAFYILTGRRIEHEKIITAVSPAPKRRRGKSA